MAKDREKTVTFYQLTINDHGTIKRPTKLDWMKILGESLKDGAKSVEVEGVHFQPELTYGTPLLGLHKPVDPAFMTQRDPTTGSMTDLMTTTDGSDDRFYSTAVRFLSTRAFAIVLGAGVPSPRHTQVVKFLDAVTDLGDGAFWVAEPVMNEDQIVALRKEAKGLLMYSGKYHTTRNLFDMDEPEGGILSYTDKLAHDMGADLEVTISVRIASQSDGPTARERFRDLVVGDLARITADKKSNAKVLAVMGDDAESTLDLVAHKLAMTFTLPASDERDRFSTLLREVDTVGGEQDDTVKKMIEGSPGATT